MKTFLSIGLLIAVSSAKKLSVIPYGNKGAVLVDDGKTNEQGEDEYFLSVAETHRRKYDWESYIYPNVMGEAGEDTLNTHHGDMPCVPD